MRMKIAPRLEPFSYQKHEWDLILEEYKTLRQEILNKMDKQYQIMGLGVGGISALLGFAFEDEIFPIFLVLPLIIVACIFLYDAEKNSILNAGQYIRTIIEEPVFAENKRLGWERWLFQNRDKLKTYDYIECSSLVILYFLYLMSAYGIIRYWPNQYINNQYINTLFGEGPGKYIVAVIYLLFGSSIFIKHFLLDLRSQRKYLFNFMDKNKQVETDLNSGILSERLKALFKKEHIELTENAAIMTDNWRIVDKENVYVVSKEGVNLNFHKI